MILLKYISRRLLEAIVTVFAVITLNFLLIHAAPGDPVYVLAGETVSDPAYLDQLRVQLGLDKPLYVQYVTYIWELLHGNLGYSYSYRLPVRDLVLERAGATISLMLIALCIFSTIGTILGLNAARKPYSWRDNATTVVAVAGWATPEFWLGQMLLLLFAFQLGWLPVGGMASFRGVSNVFLDRAAHFVLPAFALGMRYLALTSRFTRGTMLETLGLDYIVTARAKGLSENDVYYRHALPNALLPVVTMIGMYFAT